MSWMASLPAGLLVVIWLAIALGIAAGSRVRASDFYRVLSGVAARNHRGPLTLVAFDVLAFDGPVIDRPYSERRALLDGLELDGSAWCAVRQLCGSVSDVLRACAEHDVEGVVAKRVDSPYRPGERWSDWLELKTAELAFRARVTAASALVAPRIGLSCREQNTLYSSLSMRFRASAVCVSSMTRRTRP